MLDSLKITYITRMNWEEINILIQVGVYTIKQWCKFQKVISNYLFLMLIFFEQPFLDDVSNIVFCDDNIRPDDSIIAPLPQRIINGARGLSFGVRQAAKTFPSFVGK